MVNPPKDGDAKPNGSKVCYGQTMTAGCNQLYIILISRQVCHRDRQPVICRLCKPNLTQMVFLGSTSIVGVAKKNKYQVVSRGNSRHDFYAWENKILFLKLRKFRIPKQTRFKTLVLLLQPSMKPFDHGTSMELRISSDQLR